jgi:hypothetical protein
MLLRDERGLARLIDLPPATDEIPGWLLALAEASARRRFDERGLLEFVPHADAVRAIARARVEATAAGELSRWARWIIADPRSRSISPRSGVGFDEHLERLLKRGDLSSLREARRLDPGSQEVAARLAVALRQRDGGECDEVEASYLERVARD